MDGVNVKDGIDIIQRTVLPVFDLRKDLVCNIRNKSFRGLKSVDIFNSFRYLPGSHSLRIHGNDLLVNIRNVFLAFFDHLWFKGRFSVLRHIDFHGTETTVDPFSFVTVPVIIIV